MSRNPSLYKLNSSLTANTIAPTCAAVYSLADLWTLGLAAGVDNPREMIPMFSLCNKLGRKRTIMVIQKVGFSFACDIGIWKECLSLL
jgi:hypothetical protein